MGNSSIHVGTDKTTAMSSALTQGRGGVHAGGFFRLDSILEGDVIAIRRYGTTFTSNSSPKSYTLMQIRAYEIPNLIEEVGAQNVEKFTAPPEIWTNAIFEKVLTNFANRATRPSRGGM